MTRQIYLHRLKEALEGLPREEQESAMRYCEEYFDEAGEDQFEQAVHDLGSPEEFAKGIRSRYNSRINADQQESKKWPWPLILCLALVASPIWVPFGDHFWIPSVFAVYGHSSSVVLILWTGWIVVGDGRQNDFCFLGFGRTGFGRNADLHGVVSGLLMRLDSSG